MGLSLILGFVIGPIFIASNTMVHLICHDDMRGKVFSALEIDTDGIGSSGLGTGELSSNEIDEKDVPEFIVMTIADIVTGIESQTLFYASDLRRALVDQSFREEYVKRTISDYPQGNENIIDDATGEHLDYHAITWREFITKQIVHRIKFKYERSGFPPTEDTKTEMLTQIGITINTYDFSDFEMIDISDLNEKLNYSVGLEELSEYKPDDPLSGGKLHVIKFF